MINVQMTMRFDHEKFLRTVAALDPATQAEIAQAYPLLFGDCFALPGEAFEPAEEPPPKSKPPRERKPRSVPGGDIALVRTALNSGADTTQLVMSRTGLTDRTTRAAIKALIEAGEAEQVGKGRGARYKVKEAAT